MTLQINQVYHGFRLVKQQEVADIRSRCSVFVHEKSGARLFYAQNDDENKVFFVSFRTPPNNDCGTAHIMEHSVLCGSKKYPAKDPFNELMKGSLNTYLNALTYSDKTMYPVASCNEEDFRNLMDVYLDAVFFPNVIKERRIFEQEGWHYELLAEDAPMTIKGVVYNEMKGALASADGVLDGLIHRSLFPHGTYGKESGGDPKAIPTLTYEAFCNFYRTYYHPSNSYFYLYGNLDLMERLAYLDEAYLSQFEKAEVDSQIQLEKELAVPGFLTDTFSVPVGTKTGEESMLSLNFVVGLSTDRLKTLALTILSYVLMETGASPVKKALLERKVCQSGEAWFDSSCYQMVFSFVAKNANCKKLGSFKHTVYEKLRELVAHGFPKEQLRSAINSYEFSLREEDYGYRPKGLAYGMQMMKAWLHDGDPMEALEVWRHFDTLRDGVENGYFERLVQECFLENKHVSLTAVAAEEGRQEREEAEEREQLAAKKAAMTKEEVAHLVARTKDLIAYQQTPDRVEDIQKVPCLKREDINKNDTSKWMKEQDGWLLLPQQTNAIYYGKLMFTLKDLTEEELPYAAILARTLGKLDTRQYSYEALATEIDLYTGGVYGKTAVFSTAEGYEPFLLLQGRALERNGEMLCGLWQEILQHTDFTQTEHLEKILLEWKAEWERYYDNDGHAVAVQRASSMVDLEGRARDLTEGITLFDTLRKALVEVEETAKKLQHLAARLLCKARCTVALSAEEGALDAFCAQVKPVLEKLPQGEVGEAKTVSLSGVKSEAVTIGAKIVYNAQVGHFTSDWFDGRWNVVKNLVNTEYLWNEIRVKGGAYGCGMNVNRKGYVSFYSYRDPNVAKTYEGFAQTVPFLAQFAQSNEDMTKYILGAINVLDRPKSFGDTFALALNRYLLGVTPQQMQQEREEMLAMTAEDLLPFVTWVEEAKENAACCTYGNGALLEGEEGRFASIRTLM